MASPTLREGFEYAFSRVDPVGGAHIDPPAVAIYETLVAKGPRGEPIPYMARTWSISQDATLWRFELRPDLRFHSGAPCDAKAVVAALERCRWGDARTRQMQYFDMVDTIADDGPTTVTIRTHYPTTRLMQALWGTHSAIFSEAMRAEDVASYGIGRADGTGPYRLLSHSPDRLVAEVAPTYAGTELPMVARRGAALSVRRIEWVALRDEDERIARLLGGEVDLLHAPPAVRLAELKADERFETTVMPQPSNIYMGLNFSRRDLGFNDLRVRRAVSLAIDREALVREIVHGLGVATHGAVPPGSEFHEPQVERTAGHDPAAAGSLFEEAGWLRGEDGLLEKGDAPLAFVCVVQDDSVLLPAARLVAAQLRRVGVDMDIEAVAPFAPFYERISAGPAAFLSKWLWQDPIDALIGFSATGCQPRPNWQRASLPRLDMAFERFRRAPTRPEAEDAAREVQWLIARELPMIPLFTPHDIWANRKDIRGWRPRPGHLYPYYQDVVLEGSA